MSQKNEARSSAPGSDNYWPPMPETRLEVSDKDGKRWEVFFSAPKNTDEFLAQFEVARKHAGAKQTFDQKMHAAGYEANEVKKLKAKKK